MSNETEVTIYDIADKLGLSSATVSRALRDDPAVKAKTKKLVLEMAESLNYRTNFFARNLRSKNTKTIGVIIPTILSQFMASVISGIESVTTKEGYSLIISQSEESLEKEILNVKTMFNNRVDGLLVSLSYETENNKHFESYNKSKIPVIFFDRVFENGKHLNIVIDNKKAAYQITEHLINQGCKRIAHIGGNLKRDVYSQRLLGYQLALKDYKLKFNEDYLFLSNLSFQEGTLAAKKILTLKQLPDAVFAANDTLAVGCLLELKASGLKIPEDMAIAGFNNDSISRVVEPKLTTINYPGYDMGVVSARTILNNIKENLPTFKESAILLPTELIIRESTMRKQPSS
jgi:LacI family transcriptional regulator